jgi:glycosyltransferase involved in cell wall biosynthesis
MTTPLISCLIVTQEGRQPLLEKALDCLSKQTWKNHEAVIVHDEGQTLGALRNLTIQQAKGEILCQWDDDDLYHPERLEAQYNAMAGKVANYLESQFYYFPQQAELFIRDDKRRIEGTLMMRSGLGVTYPESGPRCEKGEDTAFAEAIYHKHPGQISTINRPELYCRVYHGANTWHYQHHHARLAHIAHKVNQLKENETSTRAALKVYGLSGIKVRDFNQVAFEV